MNSAKEWLRAAGTRALKTIAQAAIAGLGTATMVQQIDWQYILSVSVIAGVLSLLTSIVSGLPESDTSEKYEELIEIGQQILEIAEGSNSVEAETAETNEAVEEGIEEEPEIAGAGLEDVEVVG